jgi:hypothetical protein
MIEARRLHRPKGRERRTHGHRGLAKVWPSASRARIGKKGLDGRPFVEPAGAAGDVEGDRCQAAPPRGLGLLDVGTPAGSLAALQSMNAEGRDATHGGQAAKRRGQSIADRKRAILEWERGFGKVVDLTVFEREVLPLIRQIPLSRLSRRPACPFGTARRSDAARKCRTQVIGWRFEPLRAIRRPRRPVEALLIVVQSLRTEGEGACSGGWSVSA